MDGFVRHAWFALSVFSRDGKLLFEAVFEVARGSRNFGLVHMFLINWMVLLGTHGLHSLFCLVMENSCLRQFLRLPEAVGILSLSACV